MGLPGPGDAAALFAPVRGALARDEAQVGHERPRVWKRGKSPSSVSRVLTAGVSRPQRQRRKPNRGRPGSVAVEATISRSSSAPPRGVAPRPRGPV
jgi:hypothetical protein